MCTTKRKFFNDRSLCRRDFLGASLGTLASTPLAPLSMLQLATSLSASLTKEHATA